MAILPKGSEIPTIVEGAEDGARFQVEVSAHLMSLLAGLYSKREDSIVREVLCNAYDAQKSIGVDVPVVIEAPSESSPVLKIRDQGPGMSKDTVFRVYASYGTSTKGNSNEQTGGMGVGAKAVFCYTDTFTVISWHDGTESTYVAYADGETGIPRIDLMASVPCAEGKTGVEVQIPVQLPDISTFNEAISWNGRFHATAPIVVGGKQVSYALDELPVALDLGPFGAPGWTAYPGADGYSFGVVMGSVFYPLTQEQPVTVGQNFVKNFVIYQAPMGDVRFAPSREALKYDEVTVNNLRRAKKAYLAAFEAWVTGLVDSADARFPGLRGNKMRMLNQIAQSKGVVLSAPVLETTLGKGIATLFHPEKLLLSTLPYSIAGDLYYFDTTNSRREATSEKRLVADLVTTSLWVNDCTGGEARLRAALDLGAVKSGVLYTRNEAVAVALATFLGFDRETFVRYTSSLPEVVKAPRTRIGGDSVRVGGTLSLYPTIELKKVTPIDADEALEKSQGIYVEAMLGGYDWRSVSSDGKFTLSSLTPLETVRIKSPWCPEPVSTAVLRLNAADREKLKKKGVPLTPLADVMLEALDMDEIEQAVRDWRVLSENQWVHAYANNTRSVLMAWEAAPPKLQDLLAERLNLADEGLGNLLREAIRRKPVWNKSEGMRREEYLRIKEKVANLPFLKTPPEALGDRLRHALGNLDISRLGMAVGESRTHLAGLFAMFGALEVPDLVLGRSLCPAPAAAKRTKATLSVLPGQLSLFERAEPEDSASAAPLLRDAA